MKSIFFLALLLAFFACHTTATTSPGSVASLPYSTTSDSALYYFSLGWEQIMDEGRYGASEISFRKALSFDPDFLIGKATLGRLTLDTLERTRIEEELAGSHSILPDDERQLLSLYHDFIRFTNLKTRSPDKAIAFLGKILPNGEEVLSKLIRKYPLETYLKCEYLELIKSNKGAEVALDSLIVLTAHRDADNHFLMGFQASLEAEMAHFQKALEIADRLSEIINDRSVPKPWAVYADIYLKMDSLKLAKEYADKAVELDDRNLDATRLQRKIKEHMNKMDM